MFVVVIMTAVVLSVFLALGVRRSRSISERDANVQGIDGRLLERILTQSGYRRSSKDRARRKAARLARRQTNRSARKSKPSTRARKHKGSGSKRKHGRPRG